MWGYWGRIGRPQQIMMGLSVVLAACLWASIQFRSHTLPPHVETALFSSDEISTDSAVEPREKTPPGLETFDAIDDRPLFSPSRRPSENQDQQTGDRKEEFIGKYLLQGIVIGEAQRLALLVDPATKTTLRLAEGEDVGGWVAREIGEDFVRFEAKGVEKMIRLPKSGNEPGN